MFPKERVKVALPPEVFPPITAAELLLERSSRVDGYGIALRLVYVEDAMMRKNGEYRIQLPAEAIDRIVMVGNGTHPFELDLSDATFRTLVSL